MQLTINDRTVAAQPGESVLQCALRHGIEIPHLCTHPALPAFGACRLCLVQIEGVPGYPSSCSTPATEGMSVRTDSEPLRDLRRRILELILLEHPSACLLCEKHDLCEDTRPKAAKAGRTSGCHTCNNKEICDVRDLAADLGVKELPVPPVYRGFALERSDPFIDRDLNLCILCGRCVRICKAHQGWAVIDFIGRGSAAHIGEAFGRSLTDAGCRFCGSCVDVCPTGSLADRYAKWFGEADRYTATTCPLCPEACAITVGASEQHRAVMAKGVDPATPLCALGRFAIPEFLNGNRRLRAPQVHMEKRHREVTWDDALAAAAERLKPFVGGNFAFVCDTTNTMEDRHVFRKFTYEVMKSPHYVEITPDARGISRAALPAGTRAAIVTGPFVDQTALRGLDLLIVQDCYPSDASAGSQVVLPAAVLVEVSGTLVDGAGRMRPLREACKPPGQARPDWRITSELARALGASGFGYSSAAEIAKEMNGTDSRMRLKRDEAPPAAKDPRTRRQYFRGHSLDEKVGGLAYLPLNGNGAGPHGGEAQRAEAHGG